MGGTDPPQRLNAQLSFDSSGAPVVLRPTLRRKFTHAKTHGYVSSGVDGRVPTLNESDSQLGKQTDLQHFLSNINPCHLDDLKEQAWYTIPITVASWPWTILLTLTVPVVDIELPNKNWCRYLNAIQLVTAPLFILFAAEFPCGVPLLVTILAIGCVACVAVVMTTSSIPPRFHSAYAFLGFLTSVAWIYMISNELVEIFQTVGVLLGISQAILGLTVLAWGNCTGDAVANVAMARQGYPKVAVGACIGGPLFNTFVGMGIACVYRTLRQGDYELFLGNEESQILLGGFTLLIILLLYLGAALTCKFHLGRGIALVCITLYLVQLLLAVLKEVNLIPNFISV